MKIIDLLKLCPYESVEKKIVLYYGDEDLEEYRKLYQHLQNMIIKNHLEKDLYICITVRQINDEGTDPAIDVFDENDKNIYFDVSGFEKNDEILQSITSSSFEDFLQYSIEKHTLERFPYESILAHALWELTSYGFEDKV